MDITVTVCRIFYSITKDLLTCWNEEKDLKVFFLLEDFVQELASLKTSDVLLKAQSSRYSCARKRLNALLEHFCELFFYWKKFHDLEVLVETQEFLTLNDLYFGLLVFCQRNSSFLCYLQMINLGKFFLGCLTWPKVLD